MLTASIGITSGPGLGTPASVRSTWPTGNRRGHCVYALCFAVCAVLLRWILGY